jgi:F0F1-type ATP synthase assembly protein I
MPKTVPNAGRRPGGGWALECRWTGRRGWVAWIPLSNQPFVRNRQAVPVAAGSPSPPEWPGSSAVAPQKPRLLYFCGFAGRFSLLVTLLVPDRSLVASRHSTGCRVLNSVTAGRRLARRAIAHQAIAVCATSLACLALGVESALAVLVGGGAVTAGAALSAAWALRHGVVPSGVALARMFAGVVLKWCLVFILFSLGLLLWRLPALPLLVGVLVALAAQFVAMARR